MTQSRDTGGKDPTLSSVYSLLIVRYQTGQKFCIQSSSSFVTVCTDGRDTVETAEALKCLTRDNSTFCEWSPLCILPSSAFKRFFHCGSKVSGVVESTKCFVLSVGFPLPLSEVHQCYLYKHCSRKYKFQKIQRKMLISLSHLNFFLARSNAG